MVTPRALVLLLVGAALVVLAVNALAVRLSPASERTFDGMVVERKWKLAGEGAPDGGVVVIGDSSGNFGVDAAVLERRWASPRSTSAPTVASRSAEPPGSSTRPSALEVSRHRCRGAR